MMVCVTEWSCVSEIYYSMNFCQQYSLIFSLCFLQCQRCSSPLQEKLSNWDTFRGNLHTTGFFSKGGRQLWVEPNFNKCCRLYFVTLKIWRAVHPLKDAAENSDTTSFSIHCLDFFANSYIRIEKQVSKTIIMLTRSIAIFQLVPKTLPTSVGAAVSDSE